MEETAIGGGSDAPPTEEDLTGLMAQLNSTNRSLTSGIDRVRRNSDRLEGWTFPSQDDTEEAGWALLQYEAGLADGDDGWIVSGNIIVTDPKDAEMLSEVKSLASRIRGVRAQKSPDEHAALQMASGELARLEARSKGLWKSLMEQIKRSSQKELAKTFEANFARVELDPNKAFEHLGFTVEEARQEKLLSLQTRWHRMFGDAEPESDKSALGRQIWYTIQNETQRAQYLQYLDGVAAGAVDMGPPAALEETIGPMTEIVAELTQIRFDLDGLLSTRPRTPMLLTKAAAVDQPTLLPSAGTMTSALNRFVQFIQSQK